MKMVMLLVSLFYAVFFNSVAQAALADVYDAGTPGYHMVYDGRMAGFGLGDLSGVPILYMSVDPTIYAPVPSGTAVNVYTYQDIQNGVPGFDPVLWSQIGYTMDTWVNSSLFNVNGVTPPTQCVSSGGDSWCSINAMYANAIVWAIVNKDPSHLTDAPIGIPQGIALQDFYNQATSGAHNTFNWSSVIDIVHIPNGDTFGYVKGGANVNLSSVPVPPSAWLFASGLVGLTGIARRKQIAQK